MIIDLAVPATMVVLQPEVALGAVVFAIGMLIPSLWTGHYYARITGSVLDEFPELLMCVACGCGVASLLVHLVGRDYTPDLSRLGVLSLIVIVIGRALLYQALRVARRRGHVPPRRALLVGDGLTVVELARRAREHAELGLDVVGVLGQRRGGFGVPVLGDLSALARVIREQQIAIVFLAFPNATEEQISSSIRLALHDRLAVYTVAPGLGFGLRSGPHSDRVWGIPVTRLGPGRAPSLSRAVKRAVDVAVAGTTLLLLSPLMALIALLVRIETGPGIIFRQTRVGRRGQKFVVFKFRSISPTSPHQSDTAWSVTGSSHIGPVGRFLRKTSLDELPQLVNVLNGTMSLVGPRPERPYFVSQYTLSIPGYSDRHRGPVGMTGFAAVNGLRGDTSIEDRAYFDNVYLDNWSLWLDVKILIRTVTSLLKGS